ncbi:MAG: ATP-binding cassette domain-containing protein [Candidatus Eisenbacteria bacterium]|nr:ATP-binding cassette domain-containing protein [Candidatus Eisenbacteria bacterium]
MSERVAIEMREVTKRYPRVLANDRVDLSVREGEIHAIVGENGAGKSTLMKVLYGLVSPDSGSMLVGGEPFSPAGPRDAIRAGIGMVHQHFMLVDTLSIAENVVLGDEPRARGVFVDSRAASERVERLSREYGFELDPREKVEGLSVGLEQRVEIVKVLYRGASILILDEPTGVLTPNEVRELFSILRSLRESGRTIVFITHKLDEVLELADRITVMRDGRVTGVVEAGLTTREELAHMMVGREVLLRVSKSPGAPGETILSVRGLAVEGRKGTEAVRNVDLDVRSGEILGIAGVQGNGQTELIEAITGLRTAGAGSVALRGVDLTGRSPRNVRDSGVAHIPEDRQERGLVLSFTVAENLVFGRHHRAPYSGRGLLDLGAIGERAERLIDENDLRPRDPGSLAGSLSGGNQQKLIVARELDGRPVLVVACQPTRGVDVGAIEFVHRSLLDLRDEGAAVLLVSAELSEIMALSDTIAVMYRGEMVASFGAGEVTEDELGLLMTGGGDAREGRARDHAGGAGTKEPGADRRGGAA